MPAYWPVSLKAPTHCSARYILAQQVATCLALAAPDAPDSDQCSANTVEAVGWALAEMADMAAICHHLEVTARRVVCESP